MKCNKCVWGRDTGTKRFCMLPRCFLERIIEDEEKKLDRLLEDELNNQLEIMQCRDRDNIAAAKTLKRGAIR